MDKALEKSLDDLSKLSKAHKKVGLEISPADSSIYLMDIFVFAALNRSVQLISGFRHMVEGHNFISAAPLVRLQLDNCLRLAAASFVSDANGFVKEVLKGTSIRDLKSKENKRMFDNYLIERLSVEHPWIKNVYEHTCGYVHLSDKHIFNSLEMLNKEGEFSMVINEQSVNVPESVFIEASEAFKETTKLFLHIVTCWIIQKNHPEVWAKIREEQSQKHLATAEQRTAPDRLQR